MSKQKGGVKLRRSGKDKPYYTQQFHVTARNKARRRARLARRKIDIPHPRLKAKDESILNSLAAKEVLKRWSKQMADSLKPDAEGGFSGQIP